MNYEKEQEEFIKISIQISMSNNKGYYMYKHENFRFVDEFFDEFSYLNKNKEDIENLYNFAKRIFVGNSKINEIFTYRQLEGFVLWNKNETSNWSSSWFDKGVLIKIDDHSYNCDLCSLTVAEQKRKDYIKYSIFYLPFSVEKKLVTMNNTKDNYLKIQSNDGHICRRTDMTYEEFISLRANMTPDEYEEHNKNIKKALSDVAKNMFSLTKENPIRIYMCGTDDTSFTCYTNNMKNANRIVENILNTPSMNTIQKAGFFFSN